MPPSHLRWTIAPAVLAAIVAAGCDGPADRFADNRAALAGALAAVRRQHPTPASGESERLMYARTVGTLTVDVVGLDDAGGVWFRTGSHLDAIDQVSTGFYHRPPGAGLPRSPHGDHDTTPFGAAAVDLEPLGGGWFTFEANNDSY